MGGTTLAVEALRYRSQNPKNERIDPADYFIAKGAAVNEPRDSPDPHQKQLKISKSGALTALGAGSPSRAKTSKLVVATSSKLRGTSRAVNLQKQSTPEFEETKKARGEFRPVQKTALASGGTITNAREAQVTLAPNARRAVSRGKNGPYRSRVAGAGGVQSPPLVSRTGEAITQGSSGAFQKHPFGAYS